METYFVGQALKLRLQSTSGRDLSELELEVHLFAPGNVGGKGNQDITLSGDDIECPVDGDSTIAEATIEKERLNTDGNWTYYWVDMATETPIEDQFRILPWGAVSE